MPLEHWNYSRKDVARYWLLLLYLCTTALWGIETKLITKLQKPSIQ